MHMPFALAHHFVRSVSAQVVEAGLGHLPFTERSVVTPTGHPYVGVDFAKKLCGVSTIRSGEAVENALRACCKGIKIGKLLLHRCTACIVWIWGMFVRRDANGECICCKGHQDRQAAAAQMRPHALSGVLIHVFQA